MATIVNNPSGGSGSSAGVIVGVLITALVLILLVVYGAPAMRQNSGTPAPSVSDMNVEVPDQIDVNLQSSQQ